MKDMKEYNVDDDKNAHEHTEAADDAAIKANKELRLVCYFNSFKESGLITFMLFRCV